MPKMLRAVAKHRPLLFATVFYVAIAALIVTPFVSQALTERTVHAQLIADERVLNETGQMVAPAVPVSGLPVHLAIKRLGISFPVAKGYYDIARQGWTLDSSHVFIDAYTNPNPSISTDQTRDAVIYGHNFNDVLGKTTELVPGDILTLTTDNGYQFDYYFVQSTSVVPNDVSVLSLESKQYPVMLVTCTGLWDQSRRVMYFTPLGTPIKINTEGQGA